MMFAGFGCCLDDSIAVSDLNIMECERATSDCTIYYYTAFVSETFTPVVISTM